jgi:hypothetical protein
MTMALKSSGANSDPGSKGDDPAVQYTRLLLTPCVQYTRLLTPCVLIGRPRGGAGIAESSDGVS